MNKKQRKRKEKKARRQRSAEARELAPVQEIGNENSQTEEPSENIDSIHQKGKAPMKLENWKTHAPNWTVAIFTVVLSVIAGFQWNVTDKQSNVMKEDQRPWLRIIPQMDISGPHEGMAQLGTIKLVNSGKSPAKNVFVDVNVEKLPSNTNPSFDYNNPHVIAKTGMLYPNVETTPVDFIPVGTLRDLQTFHLVPISSDEMKQFNLGDLVFIIYVKASYTDFFHVQHWTHFCTWIANETVTKEPRKHNVNDCTEYNDTDDN